MSFPSRIAPGSWLLAFVVLCVACGGGGGHERPASIGTHNEPTTFLDWNAGTTFDLIIADLVFHRLARPGPEPETFVPDLAESWEFGADGRSILFRLRGDVRWEDGRPVNAADVVFTQERARVGSLSDEKSRIVAVEAQGDREVLFRFDRPYPDMLAHAVYGHIYPKHVLEDEVPGSFHRKPLGSGPFRVERWESQQYISFVRREDDPNPPKLDRLVVRIFSDKGASLREMEGGHLDFLRLVPRDVVARLEEQAGCKELRSPSRGFFYLVWNTDRHPWDLPRVRRAMTALVDRREIARRMEQDSRVAEGPIPPGDPRHDPSLVSPAFDPDAAERELTAAGLQRSGDGGWLGKDGAPIKITLTAYAGQPVHRDVVTLIADYFRRAGFEVDVRTPDDADVEYRVEQRDFDAVLYAAPGKGSMELAAYFGSEAGESNRAGLADPELDRLLASTDEESFRGAYARVVELQPWMFLHYRNKRNVCSTRLQGLEVHPRDPIAIVEQWWIPAELQ